MRRVRFYVRSGSATVSSCATVAHVNVVANSELLSSKSEEEFERKKEFFFSRLVRTKTSLGQN
jgi:hypothetical protein